MAKSDPTPKLKLTPAQTNLLEGATGKKPVELKLIKFDLKSSGKTQTLELMFDCEGSSDW